MNAMHKIIFYKKLNYSIFNIAKNFVFNEYSFNLLSLKLVECEQDTFIFYRIKDEKNLRINHKI